MIAGIGTDIAEVSRFEKWVKDAHMLERFFNHKETQDDSLAEWKDTTKRKVQSAYLTFMTDANLLRSEGQMRFITPPLLDIALERYLQANGETAIVKAITGEY